MITNRHRILVVDDDRELALLIIERLTAEGFIASHAADGLSGEKQALSGEFNLLVLDLGLPDKRGLDVCREIRSKGATLPILMLTSAADEVSKVLGFEFGTDDYLTKPFSFNELVLRIRALLRRAGDVSSMSTNFDTDIIRVGALLLDRGKRLVYVHDRLIELTHLEFNLVQFFAEHENRAFSFEDLITHVWCHKIGEEQTVRAQISRLRKKLNPDGEKELDFIRTIRGYGFRCVNPDETPSEDE